MSFHVSRICSGIRWELSLARFSIVKCRSRCYPSLNWIKMTIYVSNKPSTLNAVEIFISYKPRGRMTAARLHFSRTNSNFWCWLQENCENWLTRISSIPYLARFTSSVMSCPKRKKGVNRQLDRFPIVTKMHPSNSLVSSLSPKDGWLKAKYPLVAWNTPKMVKINPQAVSTKIAGPKQASMSDRSSIINWDLWSKSEGTNRVFWSIHDLKDWTMSFEAIITSYIR